jgi:hypothetical protein
MLRHAEPLSTHQGNYHGTGELNTDAQRRLSEIEQVLETGPFRDSSKRRKGQIAAE